MTPRLKIALLTLFFAICGTGAWLTARQQIRADEDVKPANLYDVVKRQLDDFRGGDFARAYEHASRTIQASYSVEQFAAMVQADYPVMTRACRVEYGLVRAHGDHATMEVYLTGADGAVMPCVYMMVREGESWRIDGARLMPPWPPEMRIGGTLL